MNDTKLQETQVCKRLVNNDKSNAHSSPLDSVDRGGLRRSFTRLVDQRSASSAAGWRLRRNHA